MDCSSESFQLDLGSLRARQEETGARHLLLCYMRGKLPDIQGVLDFCRSWLITLWFNRVTGSEKGVAQL